MTQYRQGDVFLTEISSIPDGVKRQQAIDGRHVLAEGEATGHAHAVYETHKAQMFALGALLYMRVLRETQLLHEEHGPIVLPPGDYAVRRQREYTPERVRNVAD